MSSPLCYVQNIASQGATEYVDITNRIVMGTWEVNASPVYTEWTDANHVNHRDVHRYRISGSWQMLHQSLDEYNTFINLIKSIRLANSDIVPMRVYVNNYQIIRSGNFFVTMDIANYKPYIGTSKYEAFTISIEEA